MPANKFAALIHRNTNTITLLLVYAFLEWTLIFFLLLNSLFSFFLLKFSHFFGLMRPCLFCSRFDRFFDPSRVSSSYRDLLCHDHASDISRLGFCYAHRTVAKPRDLCEDCSSFDASYKDIPSFPCLNREADLIKCSPCCGASVKKRVLIESDCGVLDYTHKGKPIEDYVDEGIQIPAEKIPSDSVYEEENLRSVDLNETHKENLPREEKTEERIPLEDDQRKQEENKKIQTSPEVPEEREEVTGTDADETEEEFSCFISSFDCNKENIPEKQEETEADLVEEEKREEETKEVELAHKTAVVESCTDKPAEAASKHLEFWSVFAFLFVPTLKV